MVYPDWWQQDNEVVVERRRDTSQPRNVAVDPVRAKVHQKNLGRYAEDSLDARIRQVRQQTQGSPERSLSQSSPKRVGLGQQIYVMSPEDEEQRYRSQIM